LGIALDTDKIDDAVLALLILTRHDHGRVWKGYDTGALGLLKNPAGPRSVSIAGGSNGHHTIRA